VAEPARAPASLRTLAREGGPGLDVLEAAYEAARAAVADEAWQAAKAGSLERMREPGFWDGEARFAVLADVELRDRIEAGLRAAGSLLGRLRHARRPPSGLVRRAAQRLLLLDGALAALAAGEPADAVLRVDASAGDVEFAERIVAMYRAWAGERGMRLQLVEERRARSYRWVATVAGFAALRVLEPEAGLHVLELPGGPDGRFERRRVRVSVAPDVPGGPAPADAVAVAAAGRARIVRRYRERPTPLVRDSVRGWRTGRLDLVLAGAFDLIE
jgi:ATP-dependent Clp protease ATP-binding subunit ClpC